jgi:hypothetical protein
MDISYEIFEIALYKVNIKKVNHLFEVGMDPIKISVLNIFFFMDLQLTFQQPGH